MLEAEVPPERVEEKFSEWEERYAVEKLEELTYSNLKSERWSFSAEVDVFRTEYNPGRLVTPEMAAVAGKEPLTQEQFREVRRMIDEKEREIQMNFKRAMGRRKREKKKRRGNLVVDLAGRVSDSLTNVSVSFELPKLR